MRALLQAALLLCAFGCAHPQPQKPFPPPANALRYGPACLNEVTPNVFVDPAATLSERASLATVPAEARTEIVKAFGAARAKPPRIIFCKSPACAEHFAGTSKRSSSLYRAGLRLPGASYETTEPTVVILRVDEGAKGFLVHELVHFELRERLGGRSVPAWFEDGAACFISNTPDCSNPAVRGVDDLHRLDDPQIWGAYTDFRTSQQPTYCQVKAEVAGWVRSRGTGALQELIEKVASGVPFYEAYGAPPSTLANAPVVSVSTELGDSHKPFTIAMWIKPSQVGGVLAHVTETPIGSGWAIPFLGFDDSHELVAQLLAGSGSGLSNFTVVRAPKAILPNAWTHVAMTWAPSGKQRLYVNGVEVASVPAGGYYAIGARSFMYVSWGSYNLSGPDQAWRGAISAQSFDGLITQQKLLPRECTAEEISSWAKASP
ncbi:MAG: LamG domain-containing protein [Myxococcaceae bacterium]